ncbi:ribonuclease [Rhodotorula paludigena]|uniref:ribonuclease n=1 Tax=Rhodotorula paludigena TaxID=86838 RepID=UPI0031770998
MSSSVVHLTIAAASGLVLGAAGALSYSRPKQPQPGQQPQQQPSGGFPAASGPPGVFPGERSGLPAQVVQGGLAVRDRVVNGASIGPISDLLMRTAYTAAYDRRNRIPAWTAEHLTAASLKSGGGDRQNAIFREDGEVPDMFRAKLLDYFKSGYDRGHMVPAADAKQSQEAMSETFLLSNIAPQVGEGFNRHYWAYLEAFCRNLTQSFDDVYVFTVPLFLPKKDPRDGKWRVSYEMIAPQGGPPSIAVPTHFAKVLLCSRTPRSSSLALVKPSGGFGDGKEWVQGAFVLPNDPIPDETRLEGFVVPVEAVERAAGLSILPAELKAGGAKELCRAIKCEVVVRRFDDAQKKLGGGRPQPQRRQTM